MAGHGVLEEDEFDHETASYNLLDESVEDVSEDEILENGESRFLAKNKKKRVLTHRRTATGYLQEQHATCHQAWRFYLQSDVGLELPHYKLLYDLGTMARRDALNLSLMLEANRGNPQTRNKMLEVRGPLSWFECHIYLLDSVGTLCECV